MKLWDTAAFILTVSIKYNAVEMENISESYHNIIHKLNERS